MMKKIFNKRMLSVVMSFVLAVSPLCIGAMATKLLVDAEETEATERVQKEELFSYDYEESIVYDSTDDYYAGKSAANSYRGNSFPIVDPANSNNKLLNHRTGWRDWGIIVLGDKYTDKCPSQYITVEENMTYKITFDWKYEGTQVGSTIIGVGLSKDCNGSYSVDSVVNTSYAEEIVRVTSDNDDKFTEWQRGVTVYFKIQNGWDIEQYSNLVLYTQNTNTAGVTYFDNITVTSLIKHSEKEISYNDFQALEPLEAKYDDTNSTNQKLEDVAYNVRKYSGSLVPTYNPLDETEQDYVMRHRPQSTDLSLVWLGDSYSGANPYIPETHMVVEGGKTYRITYQWMSQGIARENPEIGIALSNACFGNNNIEGYGGISKEILFNQALDEHGEYLYIKPDVVMQNGTEGTNEWRAASVDFTVDEDWDLDVYKYLVLYVFGGGNVNQGADGMTIYLDDIKVLEIATEALSYTGENKTDNNYDTSKTYDLSDADSIWSAQNALKASSQAVFPVADPLNESGSVLTYKQQTYGTGAVYLGADYKTASEVKEQALRVEKGKTYFVEFDYYVTGKTGSKPMSLELTAGNTLAVTNDDTTTYIMKSLDSEARTVIQIDADTESQMTEWQTITASITIPRELDTETYTYLMLRVKCADSLNDTIALYIDNTRVATAAPLAVNYTIGQTKNCKIIEEGILVKEDFNDGTNSVMWYTDNTYKKTFSPSEVKATDEIQVMDLYGVYENATSAIVKGDVDLNHTVTSADVDAIRLGLTQMKKLSTVTERADANADDMVNLKDLIRIKKLVEDDRMSDFTINNNSLANYTIVMPTSAGYDYGIVMSRINELGDYIKAANGRTNVDVIREDSAAEGEYEIIIGDAERTGVTTDLAENRYIVRPIGKKLYVNGGTEKALGAALASLLSYIYSGNSLNEEKFIDFEYIGSENIVNPSLILLSEDFNTDMAAGGMVSPNTNPYYSFFGKDACDWFLNDGREIEGTNTAFSSQNISVFNSKMILDASGPREITFVDNGNSDTRTAYVGAEVRGANLSFTYGYAEIYAKIDVCNRVCPSFWLIGNSADGKEQHYYEIDVFEAFGACSQENGMVKSSVIEYSKRKWPKTGYSKVELKDGYELLNGSESRYIDGFANDGKFHKYAVEWTEDYIYFIYDDIRVMRLQLTNGQCNREMMPYFTIYSGVNVVDEDIDTIDESKETTEDEWDNSSSFEIDYIRIYSKNFSN